MNNPRSQRALTYLGAGFLILVAFEACSSDPAQPAPVAGPQTIAISRVSLGNGALGEGGSSSVLSCDDTIDVTLALTNWTFLPPGQCNITLQCGQVRVSLFKDLNEPSLISQVAVSAGVALDLTHATDPVGSGSYVIQAELINDAGQLYPITGDGNSATQRTISLIKRSDCASGAAGSNEGGAPGEGGMGGFGGTPDLGGMGGVSEPAGGGA